MAINKNFRFKVGLDVDDVLLPCIELAVELVNKEHRLDPPLDINEITQWCPANNRTDIILEYFQKPDFYEMQKPYEGARDFIKKLSKKAEVFIVSAIKQDFMGIRGMQIQKFFPEIPEANFIPAFRKDVVDLDFMLDDAPHNILASNAKYPVLFRRPWNAGVTGTLAVNTYDEFLNLVDCIKESYLDNGFSFRTPTVIALVGPSGSGKTAITNELLKNEKFGAAISSTTRPKREGEPDDAYDFITEEEFRKKKEDQLFAETTVYAGNFYGVELSSISNILKSGKHCIIAIDICGAMTLKMQYRTCIIYVKRNRADLISTLIQRVLDGACSKNDVVHRIVSLNDEKKNELICDYVLENDGTLEEAASEILSLMRLQNK